MTPTACRPVASTPDGPPGWGGPHRDESDLPPGVVGEGRPVPRFEGLATDGMS